MEEEYSFICSFKETKKEIQNIGSNPMITEYPKILLIYDDFLNAIKLNSSEIKINFMKDYITANNSNIFLHKILIILNNIIDKYLGLDIEIRANNIEINNYLIFCIYKTVFILYEYYYYITELTAFYNQKSHNEPVSNFLTELNKKITSDLVSTEERLYFNIVKNFYIDILNSSYDKAYLETSLIEANYETIIELYDKNKFDNNLYLKSIIILIIKINDEIKLKTSSLNSFITIPQYSGICWYISILTGMCYSDKSKDLIIEKLANPELLSTTDGIFKEFVEYIITKITRTNKKYSNPITNDCEYLKKFKENQYSYLEYRYKEFVLEKHEILKSLTFSNIDKIIGCDDDYYYYNIFLHKKIIVNNKIKTINDKKTKHNLVINKIKDILEIPNISEFDKNEALDTLDIYNEEIKKCNEEIEELNNSLCSLKVDDKLGNTFFGYLIINNLYKILGISTLYLFNDIRNANYYYKQLDKTTSPPDIIFINYFDSSTNDLYKEDNLTKLPNITKLSKSNITTDDDNTIIYDHTKYKLDYLLHRTDTDATCKACSHCISGIHYEGEQYYYNSGTLYTKIKCGDDDNIKIPCSLIKQEWIPKLEEKNKTHFSLKECFYYEFKVDSSFKIEKDFSRDNICFNIKFNFIYAYVKCT